MSLKLLGFIGTAATGVLGVGAAVVFGSGLFDGAGSLSKGEGIGTTITEGDKEYQFLYKLFKKLHETLGKIPNLTTQGKDNAIKFLKEKFSGTLSNEEDKWENFKALCEAQKSKETKSGEAVVSQDYRFCSLEDKGNLKKFYDETYGQTIDPDYSAKFRNWDKKNSELWNEFKTKYPNQSPLEKFDEWYNAESELSNIKKIISEIEGVISSKKAN